MLDKKLFKKIFVIFLTFLFCSYTSEAIAQKQAQKKAESSTNKTQNNQTPCRPNPPTVSFGVLNTKAINLVKPAFPSLARQANIYGRVVVNISVDEKGDVVSAKVYSGHPLLYAASVKAALESKFEPIMLSGCPVKVLGSIYYNFLPAQRTQTGIGITAATGAIKKNFHSQEQNTQTTICKKTARFQPQHQPKLNLLSHTHSTQTTPCPQSAAISHRTTICFYKVFMTGEATRRSGISPSPFRSLSGATCLCFR